MDIQTEPPLKNLSVWDKITRLTTLLLLSGLAFYIYFASVGQPLSFFPHDNFSYAIGMNGAVHGGDRVAICLAGGLRKFELTGPTLQANLLSAYPNSDIFVVAPLDSNAFKLWMIWDSNIVAVQMVKQLPFPEDQILYNVVAPWASSSGRQGLMHYSALVERCTTLIELYENKHGFKYDWVFRTRPDGLWSHPPPPLANLSTDRLYIPKGSDWGGLNDRCSIGGRDIVLKSLQWVSSLPMTYSEQKASLIAEIKYMELLRSLHIIENTTLVDLPFCILTDKAFGWPLQWHQNRYFSASVSPIDAPGDAGGRYCRPCTPVNESLGPDDLALEFYHTTTFCVSDDTNYPPNWQETYDNFYGSYVASKRIFYESNDNFWTCIHFLGKLLTRVGVWFGEQDQYAICSLHYNP